MLGVLVLDDLLLLEYLLLDLLVWLEEFDLVEDNDNIAAFVAKRLQLYDRYYEGDTGKRRALFVGIVYCCCWRCVVRVVKRERK